jgi:AcrR family transcriptional regulator
LFGTRRRLRLTPDQRREQLIAAAREVFRETPYAGTPVRLIAERAGVTEALFYRYFGSKQNIYERAVIEPFDDYVDALTSATHELAQRSDIDREEILARFHRLALVRIADVAPLMGAVLFSVDGDRFYSEVVFARLRGCMVQMVSDLSDAASIDLDVATLVMMGVYFGIILEDLLAGAEHDPVDTSPQLASIFVRGLAGEGAPVARRNRHADPLASFSLDAAPQQWSRNQVPRGVRRELVLVAARAAFLDKGRIGARGSDIAARAGITEAFLYRLFESKEEIYAEAVDSALERGFAELAERVAMLGSWYVGTDFLQALNEVGLAFFVEYGRLCVLALFSELPAGQDLYRTRIVPHLDRITKEVARHLPIDTARIDPEIARRAIVGAQWATSFNVTTGHHAVELPDLARSLTAFLSGGMPPRPVVHR